MTKDAEPHRALETEEAEQLLPLVIEVMPGQAGEGLVDIYQPGAYEGKSLRKLCESMLKKKDLTIEEQLILEDINRQLDGGKFLSRGQEIDSTALEYAVIEETEAGEKYLYVPIRAIKPQEGGYQPTSQSPPLYPLPPGEGKLRAYSLESGYY